MLEFGPREALLFRFYQLTSFTIFLGWSLTVQAQAQSVDVSRDPKQWSEEHEYGDIQSNDESELSPGKQFATGEPGRVQTWEQFIRSITAGFSRAGEFSLGLVWNGYDPVNLNGDRSAVPASTLKLITAAASLDVLPLGASFRFSNSFEGVVYQSRLFNPEFTVSGDPTWGHAAFDETLYTRIDRVIDLLDEQGVTEVVGEPKVILNSPELEGSGRPQDWRSSWNLACYATVPTPVMLNGNCATFQVDAKGNARWLTPEVSTEIRVRIVSSARYQTPTVSPVLDPNTRRTIRYDVDVALPARVTAFTVPVHENIDWLKNLFKTRLKQRGIRWSKSFRFDRNFLLEEHVDSCVYVDLSSRPLSEILGPFLRESINGVGDRLMFELIKQRSVTNARDLFMDYGSRLGAEVAGVELLDGSGLIPKNQISPRSFLSVLGQIQSTAYFETLTSSLAVAGESGLLETRLRDPRVKGKVYAKTGTLNGVSGLVGYFRSTPQDWEPFVILTEHAVATSSIKAMENKIVLRFAQAQKSR